jgi:DNA repair protein RecN (Recombination protein N)
VAERVATGRPVLDELSVQNLGILGHVSMEPGAGLTVVTGETGAGKTMLLGALRLLTGQRAPADTIGPAGQEVHVEGRFLVEGDEMIVSRKVFASGSRAYLDGAMISAKNLEDKTRHLVEIIGQQDRLRLSRQPELRRLVDSRLSSPTVLDDYHNAWRRLQGVEADIAAIGGDRRALERERDLLSYQQRDIASAGFAAGDDELLLQRAGRLRNAGELAERLAGIRETIDEVSSGTGAIVGELRSVAHIDPTAQDALSNAEGVSSMVHDLSRHVRSLSEGLEHDPDELEAVELRLARLGDLRRKYGATLDEVLEFELSTRARLEELERLLSAAELLDSELEQARSAVSERGEALMRARRDAAAEIEQAAGTHLGDLGLAEASVRIRVTAAAAASGGADSVAISFTSDPRIEPGPLEKIASGGELSRVVLALRLATDAGEVAIVAFDEIDAGVGGETALALGAKLSQLASERQVLCVTHLPQVAAYAERHYVVTRNGTDATVEAIEGPGRLRELSRMLAGLPESEQGRRHAEELLSVARGGAAR